VRVYKLLKIDESIMYYEELDQEKIIREYINVRNTLYSLAYSKTIRKSSAHIGDLRIEINKWLTSLIRKFEFAFENEKKYADRKINKYIKRMKTTLDQINLLINSKSLINKKFGLEVESYGILTQMQRRKYEPAYSALVQLEGLINNFLEDLNLVKVLKIYPIEKKIQIKERLSELGFNEILDVLEKIDNNLIAGPEHYKDVADRCRETLEKLIERMAIKATGNSSTFESNMTQLNQKDILNVPLKRVITAIYSYFAQMGLHKQPSVQINDNDISYAVDQLYRNIEVLLSNPLFSSQT